jgi:predicted component of type VI protein secretion system
MSLIEITPLIKKAIEQPNAFNLIQLMRIINRRLATSATPFSLVISADPVPNNTESQISDFFWLDNRAEISTTKTSLSSGNATVPLYIYEALLEAFHKEEHSLTDFLNILNDRYFKLYARTVEKSHLLLTDEVDRYFKRENHPQKPQHALATCISQLTGLPDDPIIKNWLGYSLKLGSSNRSQEDLRQILSDYFSLSVQIRSTGMTKHQLTSESWTYLHSTKSSHDSFSVNTGQNNQLGRGFLLGQRCWLKKQKMCITISPDSADELQMLIGHNAWYLELAQMTRYYLRDNTHIAIYLKAPDRWFPRTTLSTPKEISVCLGRGFQINSSPQDKDIVYLIHLVKD